MQSNQFFNYFTNNNNEINGSPKIRVKAKGTTYKNEILKTISWQNLVITIYFWKGFTLKNIKNSKSVFIF